MRKKLQPRNMSDAVSEQLHLLRPSDLNAYGTAFGGRVMELADELAAALARKHSGSVCVMLSADSIRFLRPAKQGDLLIFKAAINRVWKTSMEIGIKILAQRINSKKQRHIVSAYFTFVAVNKYGRPIRVPPVKPATAEEFGRYAEADLRRRKRLEEAKNDRN